MSPSQTAISSQQEPVLSEDLALRVSLEHIYISSVHEYWTERDSKPRIYSIIDSPQVICVEGRGLTGDRYFNGKPGQPGQVTFFESEVVEAIRDRFQLPDLSPAVFRRNLIVRGICLRELMSKRFTFQGVTFEGAQECKPCVWMDRAIAMGAQSFMREGFRGGLRAKICSTGLLRRSTPAI